MSQARRGMTIHRSRPAPQSTLADAGAVLTVMQVVICIVVLVVVFTLQFLDAQRFDRAGELYQAVMGNLDDATGEAMLVGAFGTPVTKELLEDYAQELLEAVPQPEPTEPTDNPGQGGENPYYPKNLYLGHVALMADTDYPTYGTVTSGFGVRSHPISGKLDFHTGLDIAAARDANIYAVLPGRVTEVGSSAIYGNFVRIAHGNGLETVYNHCGSILAPQGAVVRRGERIALVGSTGVSTGPHLHLDFMVNGSYADPLQIFRFPEAVRADR